jgi:hypothetical protein
MIHFPGYHFAREAPKSPAENDSAFDEAQENNRLSKLFTLSRKAHSIVSAFKQGSESNASADMIQSFNRESASHGALRDAHPEIFIVRNKSGQEIKVEMHTSGLIVLAPQSAADLKRAA